MIGKLVTHSAGLPVALFSVVDFKAHTIFTLYS